ncbi:unnamed protein product [Symbiodinium necroappetens]|uniref:Uncharacterized protein n=1 Tax=Symbiodinium necroappetens TaxID=1628268 RepID=A0A812RGV8_9DINO|nr:unnamed protein product [Symbiodinium necroappetens]
MRRAEAKGRDAMQRQVELYHDPSDAAKFNLVAELMSCSWASGFGCRFFLCVLSVMTAIFTVLYVEGSRPLELDGQAESEASASNTPIFDLDERRYEGSAESIVNSVISTSMKAQGELRNLESNIRLEHTLQRLTHVLDELDEQLEGRELSTLDDDPYARLVDQNAEGLFRVSGSSGAEDTGVHARSLVVEPPHDELTLDTSVTTTTTDDSQDRSIGLRQTPRRKEARRLKSSRRNGKQYFSIAKLVGAIAAMQITGSAKELVREIPPEHLAQGAWDQQTGQHITGLMLLVTTLARRYSPLDGEAQTRAVSDFLNFNRLPGESIDAFLVRFDVLRNRAAVRGGLGVNHQGLAWLLLKAVGVSVDQLDRLLQPLNGNLPQDEAQLAQLLERIRRQGHLFEGSYRHPNQQAGVGDPGAYNYFPTFGVPRDHAAHDVPADLSGGLGGSFGGPGSWMPDHSSAGGAAEDMGQYVAGPGAGSSADSEERCTACGSYFDDWEFSSATDTDTGSVDEGIRAYNAVEVDGESRTDANSRQNELYQDYILARRRWRRYTGKPPRRYRRVNFRANRHIGKLRNGPYGRTYAAFLPPTAFAGGKGAGKTKGGFHRKNPRGKDGQVLKCSKCGSEEHLWRKCPQVISKGAGKGQGLGQSSAHLADFSRPVPASLALTSPPAPPRVETWHTGVASAALPGVAFHYHVGSQGAASSVASHASGNRYMTTLEEDLARLESVSQVSSNRSRKSRRSDVGPDSPPRWSAAETARSVAESAEAQDADNTAVEALRPGAPSPKHPPPNRRGPNADEIERNRTVVQLNSLLMAWWEADEEGSTYDTAPTGDTNNAKAYHLRTRLANDRPGLLIDPGAHDNLVGERTAQRMQEIVGVKAKSLRMNRSLSVEGVGKDSQQADVAQRMALRLCSDDNKQVAGSFTAPVIAGSDLPPLLGLKSLKSFRCILDMGNNKLYLPGPAGCEIQRCPGTVAYDLKMSDSGHLILPIDARFDVSQNASSSDRSGLDFQMSCRRGDRSASPERTRARSEM